MEMTVLVDTKRRTYSCKYDLFVSINFHV